MEISPAFRVSAAPISAVIGNNGLAEAVTPVGPVVAMEGASDSAFQRGGTTSSTQPPADKRHTGWVAVNEAIYRPQSNWSATSHEGESAVASLPRPDVIAAYHRDDAPSPAVEAERAAVIAAHFDVVV